MRRVVRAHRQFVDDQPGAGLEQLDGEQPDDLQLGGDADGELLGLDRALVGEPRSRREDLYTDPVALHGLDHRVRRDLPERRAGHDGGQFAAQRNALLDNELGVRGHIGGVVDQPDPAAVIPPAHGLDHDGPTGVGGEGLDVARRTHRRPARDRNAEFAEALAHRPLVLGVHQRVGGGQHGVPGLGERPDVPGRDVLMVERHHVAALGELTQRVEIGVRADADAGRHQRGAVVGREGEHA